MSTSGISPLDEAYAFHLDANDDEALRLATAILESNADDVGAAMLISQLLGDRERGDIAGTALARLVEAYINRGDLPAAVVAAKLAGKAGEDEKKLAEKIAKAFCKGSKRLTDVASPAPPPLPAELEIDAQLKKAKGDALLDRAEKALTRYLATDDKVAGDTKLPKLPLVSALDARLLVQLLDAMTLADAKTGEAIVTQGTEGKAAYWVVRGMAEAMRAAAESEGGEVKLAALGPGALFGEMALVSDSPRAASVRAAEPTRLLVARRETLEKLAAKDKALGQELGTFCRMRMVANLVRHSAILAAVEPVHREELMSRFETRTFDPGDVLVTEGAEPPGLFLIASGAVKVLSKDAEGDEVRIADLGPGDVVGEISLVLRRPATANVVAIHSTIALELSRDELHRAIKDHPTLLNELYELATKREEETRSVVAQEALDVEDVVLL